MVFKGRMVCGTITNVSKMNEKESGLKRDKVLWGWGTATA